ncbi:MAG: SWIM zinc finger family protein [Chloroflexota bacterium]|nr:SWIM zinc finger family protein [Chloroflexota bacterium]
MARTDTEPTGAETRFAKLTAEDVQAQTDSGSYSRGRAYFREGRIHDTVLRDITIEALCDGSDVLPYRVQTTLPLREDRGETLHTAFCTCPRGGFCKHIVALCLAWIDDPGRFVELPPLTDLLGDRSREDLIALIVRMVGRYPDLERLVLLPTPGSQGAGSANEPTVDTSVIRQQARSAFVAVDPWDWHAAAGSISELYPLMELGRSYVDVGQWADAQTVYTTVAEEACEVLLEFNDEEGEIGSVIAACAMGLVACFDAQAGLAEDQRLSDELRERLIQALYDIWRFDVLEVGGIDLAQEGPEAIARNVTDEERAMVEGWLRDERPKDWSKRMVVEFQIMLREHAGLDDEQLLEMYREAELWGDVAHLLLQLDRVDEAVAIARRHVTSPQALVAFADALIGRGGDHVGRALSLVDDRVWEAEGKNLVHDAILQDWLIARFGEHGRPSDALAVAAQRFKRQPSLQTWHLVQQAATLPGQAPGVWRDLRPALLAQLRTQKAWSTLIDIHLQDGEIAEAIDAYGKRNDQVRTERWYTPSWSAPDQDLRLAAACEVDFPDQAIAIYRLKADGMIANRQRSSYKVAAEHLARVKETLERHGRAEEWTALIAALRTEHKTLRALREELDALDLR